MQALSFLASLPALLPHFSSATCFGSESLNENRNTTSGAVKISVADFDGLGPSSAGFGFASAVFALSGLSAAAGVSAALLGLLAEKSSLCGSVAGFAPPPQPASSSANTTSELADPNDFMTPMTKSAAPGILERLHERDQIGLVLLTQLRRVTMRVATATKPKPRAQAGGAAIVEQRGANVHVNQ